MGIAIIFAYRTYYQKTATPTSATVFSAKDPPRDSLQGVVLERSGEVWWESREATKPAQMIKNVPIHQGERVQTGEGNIVIRFANVAQIELAQQSDVTFVQTLPATIVIQQHGGAVTYVRKGTIPVSVRSLHLLIDQGATSKITVTVAEQTVQIDVEKGSVTAAYNDLDFNSILLTMRDGEQFVFDDITRTGQVAP